MASPEQARQQLPAHCAKVAQPFEARLSAPLEPADEVDLRAWVRHTIERAPLGRGMDAAGDLYECERQAARDPQALAALELGSPQPGGPI